MKNDFLNNFQRELVDGGATIQAPAKISVRYDIHDDLPEDSRVCMWIETSGYERFVVSGATAGECLIELGISLRVREKYYKLLDDARGK